MSSASPTEDRIVAAWRARAVATPLVDSSGRILTVVYPGRRNGAAGPDFRDALIAISDGTLLRGAVEIHRRAADWIAHGHQHDPAYQNVILHVVGSGPATAVSAANGRHIPTVILQAGETPEPRIACPPADLDDAIDAVRAAGDAWFDDRVQRIAGAIDIIGSDETAWRGVLDVLGYGGNREGFAAIADTLSWAYLEGVCGSQPARALPLLLGAAGLAQGENAATWRRLGAPSPDRPIAWKRAGLRPANHPERRLPAAAAFVRCAQQFGAAATLTAALSDRPSTTLRALVEYFAGTIGDTTARTLAVNLILPLAAALGDDRARPLFQRFPRLPENADTRDMIELLFAPNGRALVRGAREQQGLLYVYRRWCRDKDCAVCPIGVTAGQPSV